MTLVMWLLLWGRLSLQVGALGDALSPPKPFAAQQDTVSPPKPRVRATEDLPGPPKP